MADYATEADLAAYAAGTAYQSRLPAAAPDRTRLLELAERDIDAHALPLEPQNATAGRPKLAGLQLAEDEAEALNRATCAQAVYRLEMGDEHFVRAQRERVTGRNFSAEGKLPIVGPQAYRELAAGGFNRLTTSVGSRRDPDAAWRD